MTLLYFLPMAIVIGVAGLVLRYADENSWTRMAAEFFFFMGIAFIVICALILAGLGLINLIN